MIKHCPLILAISGYACWTPGFTGASNVQISSVCPSVPLSVFSAVLVQCHISISPENVRKTIGFSQDCLITSV